MATSLPRRSLIDDLGAEITAIVTPVSVCMLLVVGLVHGLTPHGSADGGPSIGTLVYQENTKDSDGTKFKGALLNALVFIVAIAAVTFLLVVLFYYRCMKVIWGYMGFSGFTILAWLGGAVCVQVISSLSIPVDVISFAIFIYNMATVGVMAVFFVKMPIFLQQSYLVFIGAVVAFWFTHLPEWTTWLLLIAMAVYDLIAVLTPGGPLKLLVELSMERNEDIPALIYEARPQSLMNRAQILPRVSADAAPPRPQEQERARQFWNDPEAHGGRPDARASPQQGPRAQRPMDPPLGDIPLPNSAMSRENDQRESRATVAGALVGVDLVAGGGTQRASPRREAESGFARSIPGGFVAVSDRGGEPGSPESPRSDDESRPLVRSGGAHGRRELSHRDGGRGQAGSEPGGGGGRSAGRGSGEGSEEGDDDDDMFGLPDAIKLGLGDFIFYSVLVGRAAMYDMMTVYACYLAIIAGLGATLVLLAVFKKALPALPISIALGVLFYLLTRMLMDPFVVGLATHLSFF